MTVLSFCNKIIYLFYYNFGGGGVPLAYNPDYQQFRLPTTFCQQLRLPTSNYCAHLKIKI